ncbi:hypothetical protein G1H11_20310 [Phytoactinopolyspora alkaliphila]|uniref:Uncharacterized protein n=1 Tax=Phytoactinopolyspora alkaliphila TaxID=1783498 RepID=A0A6N9YRF9_9ACTN|nr:hypothetical protein [Phytoactinopolyspora alkaliphila]NED97646.1 hypothetical protein [Phytoactinopolyspora alkaliphila]
MFYTDDVFQAMHEQRARELRDESVARGLLRRQRPTRRQRRRRLSLPAAVTSRPRAI